MGSHFYNGTWLQTVRDAKEDVMEVEAMDEDGEDHVLHILTISDSTSVVLQLISLEETCACLKNELVHVR